MGRQFYIFASSRDFQNLLSTVVDQSVLIRPLYGNMPFQRPADLGVINPRWTYKVSAAPFLDQIKMRLRDDGTQIVPAFNVPVVEAGLGIIDETKMEAGRLYYERLGDHAGFDHWADRLFKALKRGLGRCHFRGYFSKDALDWVARHPGATQDVLSDLNV